jgi:hypothetical protein
VEEAATTCTCSSRSILRACLLSWSACAIWTR